MTSCATLYYVTTICHVMLCDVMSCDVMLFCVISCYVVLFYLMLCFLSRRPLSASATSVCVIPHKGEYFVPKHLRYVRTYALYLHSLPSLYLLSSNSHSTSTSTSTSFSTFTTLILLLFILLSIRQLYHVVFFHCYLFLPPPPLSSPLPPF